MDVGSREPAPAASQQARPEFQAADPLLAVDRDLVVVSWNQAATDLTGIPAERALGATCHSLLRAYDHDGEPLCRPDCDLADLAFRGAPVPPREALLETDQGAKRVLLLTLAAEIGDRSFLVHLALEPPARPRHRRRRRASEEPHLTDRQLEVLRLLAEGVNVREIAGRLGIAEPTARNHIRAILTSLECHSQLEAVAKARRLELV